MGSKTEYSAYLMAYFTGEESANGEQIYFSVSQDGLHYEDLNAGKPVITSSMGDKGIRDPFILRSKIDGNFYIIATDLLIHNNRDWTDATTNGSTSLLVYSSPNLTDWSNGTLIPIGVPEAGCVWAPEAIYDEDSNQYLVFFASNVAEPHDINAKHRIYSAYTTNFHDFSPTKKYIERDSHIIDTTIYMEDGIYYRFSKNETTKIITCDYSNNLNGSFTQMNIPVLDNLYGVEGPAVIYLHDKNAYCLMVDQFATHAGYLPLITDSLKKANYRILDESEYDLGKTKKRHGSFLSITQDEYNNLVTFFGK